MHTRLLAAPKCPVGGSIRLHFREGAPAVVVVAVVAVVFVFEAHVGCGGGHAPVVPNVVRAGGLADALVVVVAVALPVPARALLAAVARVARRPAVVVARRRETGRSFGRELGRKVRGRECGWEVR